MYYIDLFLKQIYRPLRRVAGFLYISLLKLCEKNVQLYPDVGSIVDLQPFQDRYLNIHWNVQTKYSKIHSGLKVIRFKVIVRRGKLNTATKNNDREGITTMTLSKGTNMWQLQENRKKSEYELYILSIKSLRIIRNKTARFNSTDLISEYERFNSHMFRGILGVYIWFQRTITVMSNWVSLMSQLTVFFGNCFSFQAIKHTQTVF